MVDDNVSRMGCDQLMLYSFVWNLQGYDLISLLTDFISVILEFSALTFALIVFWVFWILTGKETSGVWSYWHPWWSTDSRSNVN